MDGEHVISRGVLEELADPDAPVVYVMGERWGAKEPSKRGINRLTAKHLCKKHNNQLSPLDESAKRSYITARAAFTAREAGAAPDPRRFGIDALLLERWFLKTLINATYDFPVRIGGSHTVPGEVDAHLVRVAYGLEEFTGHAGLYTATKADEDIEDKRNVRIYPVACDDVLVGGFFEFCALPFFLCLVPEGPPSAMNVEERWLGVELRHRAARIGG